MVMIELNVSSPAEAGGYISPAFQLAAPQLPQEVPIGNEPIHLGPAPFTDQELQTEQPISLDVYHALCRKLTEEEIAQRKEVITLLQPEGQDPTPWAISPNADFIAQFGKEAVIDAVQKVQALESKDVGHSELSGEVPSEAFIPPEPTSSQYYLRIGPYDQKTWVAFGDHSKQLTMAEYKALQASETAASTSNALDPQPKQVLVSTEDEDLDKMLELQTAENIPGQPSLAEVKTWLEGHGYEAVTDENASKLYEAVVEQIAKEQSALTPIIQPGSMALIPLTNAYGLHDEPQLTNYAETLHITIPENTIVPIEAANPLQPIPTESSIQIVTTDTLEENNYLGLRGLIDQLTSWNENISRVREYFAELKQNAHLRRDQPQLA